MRERVLRILAVVAVLTAYVFYGSEGTWRFPLGPWGQSYYTNLAEGFLQGGLSMKATPDPALMRLANPYDFEARGDIPVLWDASLFEGKYYLYFSPVPVVLFYAPMRIVTGAYPNDALAATVFASIGFLFLAAIVRRPLWILLAGIGNVVPFVITDVLFYQVAAACGYAFTAAWAYSVVRFRNAPSIRWAIAMGVFLAMAIATRPNLLVLVFVQVLIVFPHRRVWLAVLAPLALVACGMLAYNYTRFGDVTELGMSYQMGRLPMQGRAICGVCGPGEIPRLVNHAAQYVFWPPVFLQKFPYAFVQHHRLDPAVAYPGGGEPIAGIAPITPLALLGSFFALLVAPRHTGTLLVLAGWIVLFALSSCWWVTARYTLDFLGLILAGALLCLEDVRPRWPLTVLAIYSIVVGLLLPFQRF
ncbi:MAG TPA: hypothetical protein VNI54_08445 [Thermoanaerobaculia bacterium]|nr:hypothetical protein [Thermoanaerobaculia bacterium]